MEDGTGRRDVGAQVDRRYVPDPKPTGSVRVDGGRVQQRQMDE